MAFTTLQVGAATFNGAGPGEYVRSDILFGQPIASFKLAPGKKANQKAPTTFGITRVFEKDILDPGTTTPTRKRLSVNLQVNIPDGFTMEEVDLTIESIAILATVDFLTRLARGES